MAPENDAPDGDGLLDISDEQWELVQESIRTLEQGGPRYTLDEVRAFARKRTAGWLNQDQSA